MSNYTPWYNWNIVESGVKHHKPNNQIINEDNDFPIIWYSKYSALGKNNRIIHN